MLNKEQLEKDKASIESLMRQAQSQIQSLQLQLARWDGALGYINDNLGKIEAEDKKVEEEKK